MSLKTAILFNGAASYIAQEAGMLDLLIGMGLNIQKEVKFIGGLSSGALMTFAVNAAFCENPPLPWEDFKEKVLFPLKTKNIYTETSHPYNTEPLRELLTRISSNIGYHTLRNLPFDSAILTLADVNLKTCWLNNIPKVIKTLPKGYSHIYKSIREHQLELELVSALMCSTAIPSAFPRQELYYSPGERITNLIGKPAYFSDGGSAGVFKRFQEFFNTYNEKFDKIYFISPNFTSSEEDAYKLIDAGDINSAVKKIDPQHIMDEATNEFIEELKEYNANNDLADAIYYCKPEVSGYDPLNFNQEKEQYNKTMVWGHENPDKIAININSIAN
ncbi:MAG: patatin-like phospholipase family protein [Cyanobacteria bacterium P01_F01_bin.150]